MLAPRTTRACRVPDGHAAARKSRCRTRHHRSAAPGSAVGQPVRRCRWSGSAEYRARLKRQCSKLGKAEIRGSCGKDQAPAARPERQNARNGGVLRVHSHLGIDQLDIFPSSPDRRQCVKLLTRLREMLALRLASSAAASSTISCCSAAFSAASFSASLASRRACRSAIFWRGPALTPSIFCLRAAMHSASRSFFNRLVSGGAAPRPLLPFYPSYFWEPSWLLCLGLCRRCGLRLDRLSGLLPRALACLPLGALTGHSRR